MILGIGGGDCVFMSEALERYYFDVPYKPLLPFLEFLGPGVHVEEISREMCVRYSRVMDTISMQAFYREVSQFLRWAYAAGITQCNLVNKIRA
jgi:hypothetical protein